jgi:hypothetical protein
MEEIIRDSGLMVKDREKESIIIPKEYNMKGNLS